MKGNPPGSELGERPVSIARPLPKRPDPRAKVAPRLALDHPSRHDPGVPPTEFTGQLSTVAALREVLADEAEAALPEAFRPTRRRSAFGDVAARDVSPRQLAAGGPLFDPDRTDLRAGPPADALALDAEVTQAREDGTRRVELAKVPGVHGRNAIVRGLRTQEGPPAQQPPPLPSAAARRQGPSELTQLTPPDNAARKASAAPGAASPRGELLCFELSWDGVRQAVRSFAPRGQSAALVGDHDDGAAAPLWGFTLPAQDQPFTLAVPSGEGYRVFVPPEAMVELGGGGRFKPASDSDFGVDDQGKFVLLGPRRQVRLREGHFQVLLRLGRAEALPHVRTQEVPWTALGTGALLTAGLLLFALLAADLDPGIDPRSTPKEVAVKLLVPPKPPPPEPPKVEEPKPAEPEQKAEPEPQPVVEKVKKRDKAPKEPAVVKRPGSKKAADAPSGAARALSRLAAAGPAMKSLLAKMDKVGSGPGSKLAAARNLQLSGLIGGPAVANAGVGTFGLGGGGRGRGAGAYGLEVLNGKGGGGIGAFGAGGLGRRGAVGGSVTRAVPRSLSVTGSIDRDAVARVVNEHLREVQACYERALLGKPSLAGKVVLEWSISTQGAVLSARTKSSTLESGAVEGCILGALKKWRFPSAKGGAVIISYPFVFNRVGD